MKNYRIKKVSDGDFVRYYPQVKVFGLFWWNMSDWSDYSIGFSSYENAKSELCKKLKGLVVEYLDVDCGGKE